MKPRAHFGPAPRYGSSGAGPQVALRATYRLQLHAGFPFAAAAAAVPYLAELGVSHLYLSPVLQAAAGSTHGYDVVDPERVDAALGGEAGFSALVETARAAGLAIVLDIVPNHMSVGDAGNRWWLDVLENGPASYYAHFFDVDWADRPGGDDRVLLPILGERYGRALTSGTLAVEHQGGAFEVRAHDRRFPLAPRSIGALVRRAGDRVAHAELQFIGDALGGLPSPQNRDREARQRRHRHKAVLLRRLAELCAAQPACERALDEELAAVNADPAALDAVLEAQNYRLAHWTVAGSQLGYRRFFDIATLVGVRNEEPDVLAASHRRVFGWVADGTVEGLRIDHVDGLRLPAGYLRALRDAAPGAWIVVEKILAAGEGLPASWPVDGTTGYDAIERLTSLFVDPEAEPVLTEVFERYTEQRWDPEGESRRARLEVMSDALHSELARLTELAARACGASPACRDYTRAEIETMLAEMLAGYPTYRTYLGEEAADVESRARIAAAARAAVGEELDPDLRAFLEAALAFELPAPEAIELARTAQQVTGAIIAKGDEDTLLYRQVRLLARCEVGCDLERFASEPSVVHAELAAAAPRSMIATATHDTKRGEDVRARIAAISELPEAWSEAVDRWRARAERGWGDVAPDRVFEYAMWQTLVGAWPLPIERAKVWAEKATREARLRTSWRRPDAAYEAARGTWIEGVYADRELIAELERFARELAVHGDRNSLAQLLIKLTAPGVPDIYQGCELRDDSLVDPDNRRPVDLGHRAARLRELAGVGDVHGDLGLAKLWTIRSVLGLRARDPARFDGAYAPVVATGAHAHRVFAFARGDSLIAVVPRLGARAEGWAGTSLALPPGPWRDVLSGREHSGTVELAELWRELPVALLTR